MSFEGKIENDGTPNIFKNTEASNPDTFSEENTSSTHPKKTSRYMQIDLLKGIMIFLVIVDHTLPQTVKSSLANSLWERISIPVFLIIMGLNVGLSYQRQGKQTLKEMYSWKYFKHKLSRYLVPFLIIYIVANFVGLILYDFDLSLMFREQFYPHFWTENHLWIGIMPFWGPGNWFIPVLLQSIFIIPFLYKLYSKKPQLTLICGFLFDFLTQLSLYLIFGSPQYWNWNDPFTTTLLEIRMFALTSVLFYISPIILGMWFSDGFSLSTRPVITDETRKKTIQIFVLLGSVSLVIIISIIMLTRNIIDPSAFITLYVMSIWVGLMYFWFKESTEFSLIFPITAILLLIFIIVLFAYGYNLSLGDVSLETYLSVVFIFMIPILFLPFFTKKGRNLFMWISFPLSALYLIAYQYYLRFEFLAGDYNFFVFPYSGFLILLTLNLLPNDTRNKLVKAVCYIGKATYHVLLTQMFYFGILYAVYGDHYFQGKIMVTFLGSGFSELTYNLGLIGYLLINWIICITIGTLWYYFESKIRNLGKNRIKNPRL